jgi:CheY-like chemotaxis protein
VARRIRRLPRGTKKLIVAITGYGQERDRQRSSDAGFDAHLVKPVDFNQLLSILETMASEAAAPEELEASRRVVH